MGSHVQHLKPQPAADPPLLHTEHRTGDTAPSSPHTHPKGLYCPLLHPWSERLLTQPKLYMHVTLAGTLHFLVHALHSLQ